MIVSHFELVFKPQAPVPPADTVLQGYFLNVTNLEDVELAFRLDFVTSSIPDPNRTLAGNTLVIVDIGSVNNNFAYALQGGPAAKSFRLSPLVRIPAHATAKIAVLPSDPFPVPVGGGVGFGGPANFEARGYVTLRLPALLLGPKAFKFTSQLDRAAKVLVSAQNRATYFRDAVTIEGQTQANLSLASGMAQIEVRPERGPQFKIPDLIKQPISLGQLVDQIDIDLVPDLLAELMAVAAVSGIDTKDLNAALKEAGIGMALERRQIREPGVADRTVEPAQ